MKAISPSTAALLQELVGSPGIFARLTKQSWRSAVIDRVAATGEVAAVPTLASFLFDEPAVSLAACRGITRLMSHATSDDLLTLDEQLRWWFDWDQSQIWRKRQPEQLAQIKAEADTAESVLAVISCHPNGRVREAAVRQLEGSDSDVAVGFQLVRLNDWVEPVRCSARTNLLNLLERKQLSPFLTHLSLVLRLSECGREDHTVMVETVLTQLSNDDHTHSLSEALNCISRFVRRKTYAGILRLKGSHRNRAIENCLISCDPVLRLWSTRDARCELTDGHLRIALQQVIFDQFAPVRREAALTALDRFPEEASAIFRSMLLDRSASLREFARFHLRKIDEIDFSDFYRQAIAANDHLTQAISGLGETGDRADAKQLLSFTKSPFNSIRRATVQAVGSLDAMANKELLLSALQDASPKVSAEARKHLKSIIHLDDLSELHRIFHDDNRTHVRVAVIALLDSLPFWDALPSLILAASSSDEVAAGVAHRRVMSRVNQVFTKPNECQTTSIKEVLRSLQTKLPADVADQCRRWTMTQT